VLDQTDRQPDGPRFHALEGMADLPTLLERLAS